MAQELIGKDSAKFAGMDRNKALSKPSPADNDKNQAVSKPDVDPALVQGAFDSIRRPDKSGVGKSIFDKE